MMYEDTPDPTTFREAEILGLRLMQEGSFEEALIGKREKGGEQGRKCSGCLTASGCLWFSRN
jgi:hypothetical protein